MKNKSVVIAVIVVLAIGGYLAGMVFSKKSNEQEASMSFERDKEASALNIPSPERQVELRGRIQAVDEAEIVVGKFEIQASPSGDMTPEEREERREQMQSMSDAERQAIREERQNTKQERQIIGEETVLISPETKIYQDSTGRRSEEGSSFESKEMSLSEIEIGSDVMVWTKEDGSGKMEAEFIIVMMNKDN